MDSWAYQCGSSNEWNGVAVVVSLLCSSNSVKPFFQESIHFFQPFTHSNQWFCGRGVPRLGHSVDHRN